MIAKPIALVIDDDKLFLKLITTVLAGFGFMPVVTSDTETFLKKAASLKHVLALVDLNLGTVDVGFKLIESYRKIISMKTPLIVFTGSSEAQKVSHAIELGATDFLDKSVDKKYLGLKLSRYAKTPELSDFRKPPYPVKWELGTADLQLDLEVDSINEFGITLRSQHLFPIGMVFKVGGTLLEEFTGKAVPALVTVIANAVETDTHLYKIQADFDLTNSELLESVRNAIAKRQSGLI